jgi:hypothetical protein
VTIRTFSTKNIFCSDVTKRVGFLPTAHKADTSTKEKKNAKTKLYILQCETMSILKKKEKRKKRKKEKEEGSTADPPCCGAKLTHGQPPMLHLATPPIPAGQTLTPLGLTFKI